MDFISLVKNALEEENKSLEDLFKDQIVSKDTFYKYRQRDPSLSTIIKIANYLKVSIDYLLEIKDENSFSAPYIYDSKIFYDNLLSLIGVNKISCRKFCKDLNYSRDNVLRWKKGAIPRVSNLIEISNYFNCSIDDLLL